MIGTGPSVSSATPTGKGPGSEYATAGLSASALVVVVACVVGAVSSTSVVEVATSADVTAPIDVALELSSPELPHADQQGREERGHDHDAGAHPGKVPHSVLADNCAGRQSCWPRTSEREDRSHADARRLPRRRPRKARPRVGDGGRDRTPRLHRDLLPEPRRCPRPVHLARARHLDDPLRHVDRADLLPPSELDGVDRVVHPRGQRGPVRPRARGEPRTGARATSARCRPAAVRHARVRRRDAFGGRPHRRAAADRAGDAARAHGRPRGRGRRRRGLGERLAQPHARRASETSRTSVSRASSSSAT